MQRRAGALASDEVFTSDGRKIRLQNRDRGGSGSQQQMNRIAAAPRFLAVAGSNDMMSGAPVVFGNADELPAGAVVGRTKRIEDGRGDTYRVRYAVVDAGDIITSHNADGTPNASYATGEAGKLRAVAGNGRAAGLIEAWQRGTMAGYRAELLEEAADEFGIDPAALEGMKQPVLVRVMNEADITADMGDRTNTAVTAQLTPQEQAANDAKRIDLTRVDIDERGQPTRAALDAFIQATPEAERAGMLDARTGEPTKQAAERFMAAIFKQAYQSDELVRLYAQATDPDARNVLHALAQAAPVVARLSGTGQYDLREAFANMAHDVVNAARRGENLRTWVKQDDFGRSEETRILLDAIADDIRAPRRMGETLKTFAQQADEQADIERTNQVQGGFAGMGSNTVPRAQLFSGLAQRVAETREAAAARGASTQGELAAFSRTPVAGAVDAMFSRAAGAEDAAAQTLRDLTVADGATREQALDELKKLAGKPLVNEETGITAYVNRDQRDKLVSDAAVHKSEGNGFSAAQHHALAERIEQLWKHAVFIGDFPDKRGEKNVHIKRFAVAAQQGGEVRYATILAKETVSDADGHRIYTLELHTEKTLRGIWETIHAAEGQNGRPATRSVDEIVRAVEAKVKPQQAPAFSRAAQQSAQERDTRRIRALTDAQVQHVREVRRMAAGIVRGWKNAPPVVVAHDISDLSVPRAIRDMDAALRRQGAQGEPEGVYYNGTVYVFAGQVNTPEAVARLVAHEVEGHHGLRGMFGSALGGILNDLTFARKPQIIQRAREYGLFDPARLPEGVTAQSASNGDIWRAMSEQQRRMAAEEYLTHLAETEPQLGFVRRAVAAIRTWLRQNVPGFGKVPVSDDEIIRSFILPAREWVQRGSARGAATSPATPRFSFAGEQMPQVLQRAIPQREARTLDEAREQAQAFIGRELTNESTGRTATVSRANLRKMTSEKAHAKSADAAAHALAVANVDALFEAALLDNSHADRKGEPTIAAIHRFVAPMVADGRVVAVKMTVKETTGAGQPNPIYSIEAVEIENPPSVLARANPDKAGIRPQAGFANTVWQRLQQVKRALESAPMFSRSAPAAQAAQQAWPMKPQQVRELGNRMREQAQRKLEHMGEAEVNALARQLLGRDARASKQENIPALLNLLQHDMTVLHDALGLDVSEPTRRAAEQQRNPQWQEEQQRGRKLDFGGRSVDELAQEYAAMKGTDGGRLIDVDRIRELSPEYRADRSRASDIHEAASSFSQRLFERALAQPVREGRRELAVFTAGGGGSGKSSAIDRLFAGDDADVTLDGTFANLAKARARVKAALESGRDVEIRYVYRSPEKAAQGAIQRAIKNGRPVPTSALAKAHAQSLRTVRSIAEEFKNDERVRVIAIDNNGVSLEDTHVTDISNIPEVSYDDAKRTFDAAVDAEWEAAHGGRGKQAASETTQQAAVDAQGASADESAARLERQALRGSTQGGRSPSGGNAVITSDAKSTFDAAVDAEWEAAHGGREQQADSQNAQQASADASRASAMEGGRGLEGTTVRGSAESGGARGHLTRAQYKAFTGREPPAGNGGGNGSGGGGEGSTGYAAPAFRYSATSKNAYERAQAIIDDKVKSGRYFDRAMRALTRWLGIEKLTRAAGSAAARALDRFTPEKVKAGLVADYGLPQEAIDARALMQGAKLRQLRKAGSFVEKLATMTAEEAALAYDWMTNESHERVMEALVTLPDDKIQVLAQVRDMVDALGAEAVKLGLLSNTAYQRNKGAYLHRSYAKHVLGEVEGAKGKRRGGGATTAIIGTNLHHRGKDEVARMEQVRQGGETWWDVSRRSGRADENFIGRRLRRLERRADAGEGTEALPGMEGKRAGRVREVVYVPAGDAVPQQYAGWHDAGVWEVRDVAGEKLQLWRDYTAAERAEMGEIKDVRYAIMATLQGMIGDVETARYLQWVAREYAKAPGEEVQGDIVDASEGYLRPFLPGEWVRVPETNADGTKAKRYGALAGKYVPGPVFNDIRHMLRNGRWLDGLAGDAFHTIMQAWKTSKTSLSPTVHVNNIMSNFVMADWADLSPAHLTKAMRIIMGAHDLKGEGLVGGAGNLAARATGMADREAAREIVQRYKDSGGELGSWTVTETMRGQMEPMLERLQAQAAGDPADMRAHIGAFAALQRLVHGDFKGAGKAAAGAVAREAKTVIDLYGNEDAVFRLAAWLKAKEEGKSDIEAGRIARRAFLDYNINAPWIQMAKGSIFPFISFSYRGFPLLARTLAEKPHKMMKFVLFATALNQLGLMLAGADDDDEVRRLLPDEKAGRVWGMVPKLIRMPWNDKNDSPVYLDIRRWIPMGDVFDVGQHHAALPLPPALMPGGPLAVLGELLFNKSQFTGKEIMLETDTPREQAGKVAEHLYKSFAPNVPMPPVPGLEALDTWATTNIRRALRGETDVFGREQSVGMAAAGGFGVKLGAYPPDVLRRNVAFDVRRQEQEIGKNISAIKRQLALGRITPEEAQKKMEYQQAKKRKVREEGARRMGAGEDKGAGLGAFLEQLME